MKLSELLALVERFDAAATKGPWYVEPVDETHGYEIYRMNEKGNASVLFVSPNEASARFITMARTSLPDLASRLKKAVEALYKIKHVNTTICLHTEYRHSREEYRYCDCGGSLVMRTLDEIGAEVKE